MPKLQKSVFTFAALSIQVHHRTIQCVANDALTALASCRTFRGLFQHRFPIYTDISLLLECVADVTAAAFALCQTFINDFSEHGFRVYAGKIQQLGCAAVITLTKLACAQMFARGSSGMLETQPEQCVSDSRD